MQARNVSSSSYLNLSGPTNPEHEAALEDHRLLTGLQSGDEAAYEQLIQRFQGPVYNLAWRLLNNPSDASDVVQEVFLKVFRSVGTFRGESSLRTWIYRIAVNESHNRRRWHFRHRRGETGIEEIFEDQEGRERPLLDNGETPFDFTMNREAQHLMEEGLSAINPVFGAALVLREVEDLSYEEIAQVLDVSIGTVKSRILRGRDALGRYLANRLDPAPNLQLVPRTAK
ncbi:MAG: polymerase, sigma-24 subunit, subfamily [Bryobacterales bacterium]|nr:polymerase, sigma-24 subunit, subfamily [Bryobacterales bacterium]